MDTNRKKICLLDDNIFGYRDYRKVFEELINTGKPFQFKQGLDMRVMTDEKAELLIAANYDGDFIFAFDNIKDKHIIEEKLKIWWKHWQGYGNNTKFYILCGFEFQDINDIVSVFERIRILAKYRCRPYIMRHKSYMGSEWEGVYNILAAWTNQLHIFHKWSFREFSVIYGMDRSVYKEYRNDWDKYLQEGYNKGQSWRELERLEKAYPEVAKKYFDLKYDEWVEKPHRITHGYKWFLELKKLFPNTVNKEDWKSEEKQENHTGEIVKIDNRLPATIDEIIQKVHFNREVLNAYRVKMKAIENLKLTKDERDKTLIDAQEVAKNLLLLEAKLGEMLKEIPNKQASSARGTRSLPEGITKKESHYAQQLADNKDIITEVIEKAKEKEEIPTRIAVLREISKNKKKSNGGSPFTEQSLESIKTQDLMKCLVETILGAEEKGLITSVNHINPDNVLNHIKEDEKDRYILIRLANEEVVELYNQIHEAVKGEREKLNTII